jgi:hypothetical protein
VWLDAGWATEALAVAFPDTAATMVDHWLKCAKGYERIRALAALQRLPGEMAEPRLRLAASDPALAVREGARRQWLERFERSCPVGAADVLSAELLQAPPSERFGPRLAVMQGRVREARLAMARALLAEAPDREALVLLLQLVRHLDLGLEIRACGQRVPQAAGRPRWPGVSGARAWKCFARGQRAFRSPRASGGCVGWGTSWSAG